MTVGDVERPAARRPGAVFVVATLIAFSLLLALGTWQVQRLQWKENLLATIDQRIAAEPNTLGEIERIWERNGDVEYYPVSLTGTFDHTGEQHFLATHQGQSGWYVYTPMLLADGRSIIVNRGFVPYDLKEVGTRPWVEPAGEVTVTALSRNPLHEKPSFIVPDNAPEDNLWYWKDFEAMRAEIGLTASETVPFFADIRTYDDAAIEFPVPGVTQVSLPNNHLQYAVTWYGLAAALAAVAGFMFFRKPETAGR